MCYVIFVRQWYTYTEALEATHHPVASGACCVCNDDDARFSCTAVKTIKHTINGGGETLNPGKAVGLSERPGLSERRVMEFTPGGRLGVDPENGRFMYTEYKSRPSAVRSKVIGPRESGSAPRGAWAPPPSSL